jgi:GcrA cell cycle regulator
VRVIADDVSSSVNLRVEQASTTPARPTQRTYVDFIGRIAARSAGSKKERLMSWNDERVELLRKLWNEGLSASQVAAELGGGISRNAVIGKIHRLGLAERAKAPSAPRPRATKPARSQTSTRAHAPGVMGNVALAFAPRAHVAPAPRPEEDVVIPISERVTLLELRESMCRWPMGDPTTPEFRFCGAKSPVGSGPYCSYHAQVAYQPAQDRRRAREQLRMARFA